MTMEGWATPLTTQASRAEARPNELPLGPLRQRRLWEAPSMVRQYARGLLLGLRRAQGALHVQPPRELCLRQSNRPVSVTLVRKYRALCGYSEGAETPICFGEMLFLPLMTELVTLRQFPLSPLGLIHVGQRIVQRAPIQPGASIELECQLSKLSRSARGYEVELSLRAWQPEGGGDWAGTAVMLSRAGGSQRPRPTKQERTTGTLSARGAVIEAPGNMGRRFAQLSGDYNPHHLYPLTARLLGYKQPIAHGMWTLARALAHIEQERPLGEAVELDARFKRPLYLPGHFSVQHHERASDSRHPPVDFEVKNPRTHEPHVVGNLRAL